MKKEANDLIKELEDIVDKHEKFMCYARGIEFQKYSILKFELLMGKLTKLKERMIELSDEESANAMLALEYLANAFVNELKMLVFLKEDKIEDAWKHLVLAQGSLRNALQTSDVSMQFGAQNYLNKLDAYEKLLFPSQVFMSIGAVAESSKCSICSAEYGSCSHLVGKPYMGKLCHQVITKIREMKEVSFVTGEPGNKLCKVNSFTDKGHWRDRMTWRIIKKGKSQ